MRSLFRRLTTLLPWLALATTPFFLDDWTQSQLALYCCYGLVAMSLALIWGQLGLLCLGQAIFFGIGAYAMSLVQLDKLSWLSAKFLTGQFLTLPILDLFKLLLGFVLAMLVAALISYLIAKLLFTGNQLDGAFLGLVTLTLAVLCEQLLMNWDFVGGLNGLFGIFPPLIETSFGQVDFSETKVLLWFSVMLSCVAFVCLRCLIRSQFSLKMQLIRDNEHRAQHLGLDTIRVKTHAFVLSAGIAAAAGALFVVHQGFAMPNLVGFKLSTEILIWVAVGGRFGLMSAFFGAIAVRLLEDQLGESLGQYWQLAMGIIFIIVVIWFPKGVFGSVFAPPKTRHHLSNQN